MPNAIKYNVSAETLALKKGNFWIGTGDVGKGPTSSTGYYNGITPPTGGYTIYLNKVSGGPSIYTVTNDAQLTGLTNTLSVSTNLIKNNNGGNFADGTRAPFNYPYPAQTFPTVFDVSNDKPYDGSSTKYALKFPGGVGCAIYNDPSPFTMSVGVVYTFSFWYKQNNSTQSSFSVQNQGGSGDMNGNFIFSVTTNPSQTWQRISWTFTNVTNKVYFIITPMTNGSEVLMTEFTLTEGSMPGGPGLTTAGNCLNWFATQTDKIIFNRDYESIVTSGLTLNLDTGFSPSFATIPSNANSSTVTPLYDLSGNGNNGTLINGPTYSATGGGSIVLDGVDDYISIPHNSAFNFGSGAFTISLVISSNQLETFTAYIKKGGPREWQNSPAGWYASSGNGGGDLSWYWVFADGSQHTEITPFSTFSKTNDTFPLNFFTITRNSSGAFARSWNGSYETIPIVPIIGTSTWTASFDNSSDIWIGRGSSNYLNGSSAVCRIYNRALSQSEILQNYNVQKGRFGL